jgi:transketolase
MTIPFEKEATRVAFGKELLELGRNNPDIVVLGGDLNKSTNANLFGNEFPSRFFDFGPAEQNIMSVAAGLASTGLIPVVTTFAVFGLCRPFDQIRVGIAQANLNVKIVCTHAGITAGEDGASAHGIEDIALACALPGFTVLAPSDSVETVQALRAAIKMPGPFYIRLYRSASPVIHKSDYRFKLGQTDLLRNGNEVTIFASGIMCSIALEAAEELRHQNIECRVVNIHTLAPADEDAIIRAADTGAVVSVEEHYRHGGLASILAQIFARKLPVPMEVVALDGYAESGKADDLLAKYRLDVPDVVAAVKRVLKRKQSY